VVRQYARTIPDELLEAARVDGAGEVRIFVTIVVPLLRPVLASLAMMAGSVVTVLPVLALFLALQKHYIRGLLLGSVKG
jgi:multiple sugar transport system permease protein